jgi:hypothetical protein
MKIISTDNYGRDYPDECFLSWVDSDGSHHPIIGDGVQLQQVVDVMNKWHINSSRYYRVVADDYKLQPGFEP